MIRSWPYTGFASKKQPVQHCNYVSTQTGMGRMGLVYPFALAPNLQGAQEKLSLKQPHRGQANTQLKKRKSPSVLRRDRQRCRQKPGASAKVLGPPGARVDASRSPGASVNAPGLPGASVNAPGLPGASANAPGLPGASANNQSIKKLRYGHSV